MSAKAKARFAAGFILAILITVIAFFAFSFSSTRLVAQEARYEKVTNNCDTPGGSGGSPQCVVGERCVLSANGSYCDSACTIPAN